jgi:hypothetical protein
MATCKTKTGNTCQSGCLESVPARLHHILGLIDLQLCLGLFVSNGMFRSDHLFASEVHPRRANGLIDLCEVQSWYIRSQ